MRQAVVLVGGRGTRLWPLTATAPKGLLPLAGRPFVAYQLRRLAEAGVEEAWMAVGRDHAGTWEDFAESWEGRPRIRVSVESEPLDTAGPVKLLSPQLDDRFLVLNGDVIFDVPLVPFIESAPEVGIVLALAEVTDPSAYGVVVVDGDGIVERFVEKPSPGTAPSHAVNAGIYLMERRVLDEFDPGPLSFERRVFPDVAANKDLGAVVVDGSWIDIGTTELLLDSHDAILSGRTTLDGPRGHASEPGATVDGETRGAWSWVGAGAVVEPGAIIDEAVVLDGARVRAGAIVSSSVVGWGADIGSEARVTDGTLVGADCVVGPGCELAGVRLAPGAQLAPRMITIAPPQ